MKYYDYLIVGAGLFGATVANLLSNKGYKVLVVERHGHVGGMCYTEKRYGITVHKLGAHIFRTNDLSLWNYVNSFVTFKPFINSPLASVDGKLYNLPFNMNTFQQLWGITFPAEAKLKIREECISCAKPSNLEEFALSKVGRTIYEKFIKNYTEKQWGKKCTELPATILGRLPLRFTYDNNYYTDKMYQGVPIEGYTELITRMLAQSDVRTLVLDWREYEEHADKIIYTGSIDEFHDYRFGELEYRSLNFTEHIFDTDSVLGNAVINYPNHPTITREIEHKHFLGESSDRTIISVEKPEAYVRSKNERYYPIETEFNRYLYNLYASIKTDVIFGGRLGSYKYTDMEETLTNAFNLVKEIE